MKNEAAAWGLGTIGAVEGFYKYSLKPELTATRGWAAIAALIAAYELAAPSGQLLSEGIDRAIEKHPIAIPCLIGVTALHLCNWLPNKADPYCRTLDLLRGRDV